LAKHELYFLLLDGKDVFFWLIDEAKKVIYGCIIDQKWHISRRLWKKGDLDQIWPKISPNKGLDSTFCGNPTRTRKVIGGGSLTFLVGWKCSIVNSKALFATFNLHHFMYKSKESFQSDWRWKLINHISYISGQMKMLNSAFKSSFCELSFALHFVWMQWGLAKWLVA
jgi:hypothetical protein